MTRSTTPFSSSRCAAAPVSHESTTQPGNSAFSTPSIMRRTRLRAVDDEHARRVARKMMRQRAISDGIRFTRDVPRPCAVPSRERAGPAEQGARADHDQRRDRHRARAGRARDHSSPAAGPADRRSPIPRRSRRRARAAPPRRPYQRPRVQERPAHETAAGADQLHDGDLLGARLDVHAHGVADHEQRRQREQRRDDRDRALAETEDVGEAPAPGRVVLHEIDARVVAKLGDERRIVRVGGRRGVTTSTFGSGLSLQDVERFAETRELAELGECLLRAS